MSEAESKPVFTDIRVTTVVKDSLRALASVKVADVICLSGLRVIEGSRGRFVAMPSRKDAKGEYQDIFFPVSKKVREELQHEILKKYDEVVSLAQAGQ